MRVVDVAVVGRAGVGMVVTRRKRGVPVVALLLSVVVLVVLVPALVAVALLLVAAGV